MLLRSASCECVNDVTNNYNHIRSVIVIAVIFIPAQKH